LITIQRRKGKERCQLGSKEFLWETDLIRTKRVKEEKGQAGSLAARKGERGIRQLDYT